MCLPGVSWWLRTRLPLVMPLQGLLVDPQASAGVLLDVLHRDDYDNGAHLDYYTLAAAAAKAAEGVAGGAAGAGRHPLLGQRQ